MPPILAHQIAARRITNWEMGWEGILMDGDAGLLLLDRKLRILVIQLIENGPPSSLTIKVS